MKNTTSYFPSQIDDRFFFSDANLQNIITVNQYQDLIKQGKYTEATNLLNNNTYDGTQYPETDFYGAWVLNLLENRLANIGYYLLNSPEIKKPTLVLHQAGCVPRTTEIGISWVGGLEMVDTSSLYIGSNDPSDNLDIEEGDVWINLDGDVERVDVEDRFMYYQEEEPVQGEISEIYVPGVGLEETITNLENNQEWFS